MKSRLVLIAVLIGGLFTANAAFAKKPIDHFFKKPEFAGFQISPDGKHLAALAPVNTRMNIIVMDIETRKAHIVTGITNQDVNGFQWANNDRLLYQMDIDGSESFGLFAVNIDGSRRVTLAEPLAAQISAGNSVVRTTFVLDLLDDDPDHILVTNNERRASHPDVYKMNIMTGRKTSVQRNPGNVNGWFTNWDGEIVGAGFQDKLTQGFKMKNEETGEWETVHEARYDEHSFAPAAITADGVNGYVSSNINADGSPRDKAAIFEYNFETREFGDLVFEHDLVDVTSVSQTKKLKDIIAVNYMYGEPETHYVNAEWKARMEAINEALPNTRNNMTSVDDAETIGVVTSFSSQQPPVYYLFDFENNSLEFLADSRPWVKPEEMAVTKSFTFTTRDGMEMQGYLTLPAGSEGKNLPTVVHPHGGPWARDGWGYNSALQFLADRGYAVVQVNFRGSTGFGMEHWLASKKQWGQRMQDDVTDALNWAVEQGHSDPDRVCIYGGSYGGYTAMAGLTFTPDLYKCGINYVGVTDLPLLFKTAPDAWAGGMEQMWDLVGHPKDDREFLEEWSPSNHADKITAPVFMAYGLTDPRVNIRHARVMESALKKNDVPYELMVKKDEGHGYAKQENQYDFYGRMETFLAEHLNP